MRERFGLRLRFALFFAALALGGVAILVGALWLGHSRNGGPVDGYILAGLAAGFGILGLTAWIGYLFDENVARPILGLASDLNTRARADVGVGIDEQQARYLGALAPAAQAIHSALSDAREAQERAIARETDHLAREKALFEALLRDLAEGVVVVTPDNRLMLFNRAAEELLGDLGLDRPLRSYLRLDPVEHAIERLNRGLARGQTEAESFLVPTVDGERFLLGRVSPVLSGEDRLGHVLIFHDATEDLQAHAERDHLFNTLMEEVRRPAAAMGAVLDVLQSDADIPLKTRATFDAAMNEELNRLFNCLRQMEERHGRITTRHWPMSKVAADDIFEGLKARVDRPVDADGGVHFLRCDGFAIMEVLARVVQGLSQDAQRLAMGLRAERHGHEVWVSLEWQGTEVRESDLDAWLKQPLSESYGAYSGRDVLEGHRTEIWSETGGYGHRIVLPLEASGAPALASGDVRPEFYDFNLPTSGGEMADRPLSELSFVVFDTETTGLAPSGGDRIVQIAGVRIVNGRILHGEVFDTLVNPGCTIPAASTKVHGINDDMVREAPDIVGAGKAFHRYCDGGVLVAHNAPFDMAFLRRDEKMIGHSFDHPVLCTVLLSAALYEHTGQHTLDALAERFGVSIPPNLRHTALGDAMATAEVFLQMIGVMEAAGIHTLGDAIAAGQRMTKIRKAQDY
ncbi:PAS domain-containing protein [Roseovarius sp. A21]|uniref:DNA-directed DNA polymerase n=1 Tax=Roseovarius bejariae TaxID=2576383 RepID=A0A844CWE8_9RHOB|nr:exonuclease domain-containing protein [Roseovarius bejariae]MRU15476.1 PAS domain-containing protein [Roseovarius bejariae]